jgi:hypothetical protein
MHINRHAGFYSISVVLKDINGSMCVYDLCTNHTWLIIMYQIVSVINCVEAFCLKREIIFVKICTSDMINLRHKTWLVMFNALEVSWAVAIDTITGAVTMDTITLIFNNYCRRSYWFTGKSTKSRNIGWIIGHAGVSCWLITKISAYISNSPLHVSMSATESPSLTVCNWKSQFLWQKYSFL